MRGHLRGGRRKVKGGAPWMRADFQESEMMKRIVAVLAVAMSCVGVQAQMMGGPKVAPGTPVAPAQALNTMLHITESQMVSLVKAMPADKYGFAPSAATFAPSQKPEYTGVRTFGELVIHVTKANYGMAARITGVKPDVDMAAFDKLKTKDEMVAALEASFAAAHKAIDTITPENAFQSVGGPFTKATQAAFIAVHASDEYGQMVEYLRMNGMVPPASQK